ncbi:MAG: DNA mismatch repair protein MutS [Candidatus Babeliales bacterium]
MAASTTPLMQQYFDIKAHHNDALLLFQVGDFYEFFFQDAQVASAFLGIALTKRGTHNGDPIPLCGVPMHAVEHYIIKLVRGGFKVALCNQLEEAVPGKVVRRGVVQVYTPGTLSDQKLLDEKSASYLFSFCPYGDSWGLLFGELMTAQLFATVVPATSDRLVEAELARFFPDEIIIPDSKLGKQFAKNFSAQGYFTTIIPDTSNIENEFDSWAQQQFTTNHTEALKKHEALCKAAANFYGYIKKNQEAALKQFSTIHFYQSHDYLMLDGATQKNLELVSNVSDGSRKNTLLSVLDKSVTPMGSRMIKKWLVRPLLKVESIMQRQKAVAALVENQPLATKISHYLQEIGDIERIVGRCALGKAPTNDYLNLARVFDIMPLLKELLAASQAPLLESLALKLVNFDSLKKILNTSLEDDSSSSWLIKRGFDTELDRVRDLIENSSNAIIALEQEEIGKTGIDSLKIRFNKIHGYYLEITKSHYHKVPERYIRQQTLVGRERFITPELKQLQADMTYAQQGVDQLQKDIFNSIKDTVIDYMSPLRHAAQSLALCDAIVGFSRVAYENGYICPTFNDSRDILITQGKHPVVEQRLGHQFIPNDTQLTNQESLWIITGPNMGGKSTYLRQVAHICLMAQCGSFVPAKSASLPLLDRIFTRIGASDNVAEGKSTFLVEMEETATICHQATERSLVILDEVGRGTSTFDGLAIAQAVVEYIYTTVKARGLFATHYHELTALQEAFAGIVPYHMASAHDKQGIIFLHTMIRGIAQGSFGIEVAKLADLPKMVIDRSSMILHELKVQQHQMIIPAIKASDVQFLTLQQRCALLEEQLDTLEALRARLVDLDFDTLSPRKAFDLLWELKDQKVL